MTILYQLGCVISNIHVTLDHFPIKLDISCRFGQCHRRPCFLLVWQNTTFTVAAKETTRHCCRILFSSLLKKQLVVCALPNVASKLIYLSPCSLSFAKACLPPFPLALLSLKGCLYSRNHHHPPCTPNSSTLFLLTTSISMVVIYYGFLCLPSRVWRSHPNHYGRR